jgi:hypothetical protein
MRPSNVNPKLSAYELLNGVFDYNRTPLAPPGTKVIVHTPTDKRKTWQTHGVEGWYIGMAPEHYRCHRVYIPSTRSERITQCVKFLPHSCTIPHTTPRDSAMTAANKLIEALQHPAQDAPFVEDRNNTGEALH